MLVQIIQSFYQLNKYINKKTTCLRFELISINKVLESYITLFHFYFIVPVDCIDNLKTTDGDEMF